MPTKSLYQKFGKRLFDLVFTISILILLTPCFIVIGTIIYFFLGAPILFRQKRPGLNGQPFVLLKFRTMKNVTDHFGEPLPDSERLTWFGLFLRSTSLDEIPSLINVVKGEMSIVGPRPLLMQYMSRYNPTQLRRHEVKPGITGWAQVNGRNTISWEQKFEFDVWYVDHMSFAVDLRITCYTIWKLITQEGISQPGHATAEEFKQMRSNR